MAPSLSLQGLMVVICSLAVLSLAQTLDTLYVKPTTDTPCDKDPCLTLMEYADNSSQYFTRDTEAVFLPGQHLLGINISISNITFFIMRKEINAHPEIVCTAAVGLAFFNISYVSITELSFISCGDITSTAPRTWVLFSYFVGWFVMANTTVKMSHASAVNILYGTFHSIGNYFLDNHSNAGGCVLADSSDVTIENCHFYNNSVTGIAGGAVYIIDCLAVFSGVNDFVDNSAPDGGGIFLSESNVSFEGSNTFIHNSVSKYGGAIASQFSVIKFNGNTTFMNNSANSSIDGIAAFSIDNDFIIFTGNTTFIGNGPSPDILHFFHCTGVIEGTLTFEKNIGGFTTTISNITIIGTANFISNYATLGKKNDQVNAFNVLSVLSESRVMFCGTTVFASNSPILDYVSGTVLVASSTIQFMGHTIFTDNSIAGDGAAIFAMYATIEFDGLQSFEHNVATVDGGAIYMVNSVVNITGCSIFTNNSAGTYGGAISNANGQLYITGNATFIGNQARFGGGLHFDYISQFFLINPLELSFQCNSAEKGGAIYVNDATNTIFCFDGPIINDPYVTGIRSCFIHVEPLSLPNNIQLDFDGNTASDGGENIFGGMLDKCSINDNPLNPERGLSLLINKTSISTISSEPLHVCFCVNGQVDCTYIYPPPFSIVRGATISVPVVALDQVNHPVAATIRSYFPYNNGTVSDFSLGQGVQQIGATCTTLNYTILATASYVPIFLYPEGPCRDIGDIQRHILVCLLPCPIAFELSESDAQCICEMRLQHFTNACSAESQTFTRNTNFWVGAEYRDGNYTGLILHPHCPLDYCIRNYPDDTSVNDLDSQCSFNRSGILCGSCQQNLSLALGSSQCLPCTNYYLALLIPFAVAGVALVLFLFMMRLTLSTGTLSGLIFYANIVAVNKEILFPPGTTNVLTVFIAWLNLDLGIETCFFNGMDTYARTWLQYVFPFYIWLLVFIIIVVSHYSVRVPKLLGRNPIAVLATLFLLSYAKLLRTIIASFSASVLDYPGNCTDTVWLYDGNIRFLRGKHIPLFLFSLIVLLFLFLPYTVLLFLSQWLQALSNKKYIFWMNSLRMKTFLDAYHAPYNIKHRYWTGLLLLLRCVLFLVFASNTSGDPSVNLLAISSVALGLAALIHVTGHVYSKWWLGILESCFILNLGITAAATYHVLLSGGNQSAVAYLSVSVAFIEFAGIITYHMYLQLKDTSVWNSVLEWTQTLLKCRKTEENEEFPIPLEEEVIPKPPSTTFIELREPLLDFPN